MTACSDKALLCSLIPFPGCTIYSAVLDCSLSLSASLSDPSRPNLESLSVLPTATSTTTCTAIDRIVEIEGIEERLSDAIRGCDAHFKKCTPPIEKFLQRAEATFRELEDALQNSSCCRQGRIATTSDNDDSKTMIFPAYFYSYVVSQLDIIGWKNIVSIDRSLSAIVLKTVDGSGRAHELCLELGKNNFPNQAPICTSDLPTEFEIKNWRHNFDAASADFTETNVARTSKKRTRHSISGAGGLAMVYEEFVSAVESYQSLWNELDHIDENLCVLEPILPARRSIKERRIAIRTASVGGISAVLSLDCKRPRTVPSSLRFVGATAEVSKLRSLFNEYVAGTRKGDDGLMLQWREDRTVKENLELCFGNIPSKLDADGDEFAIECGICYANRLGEDGHLPDACCGNTRCARSYHEECLFEWLHSLPSARMSFDRIFGACPYCCEPISVKVNCSRSGT